MGRFAKLQGAAYRYFLAGLFVSIFQAQTTSCFAPNSATASHIKPFTCDHYMNNQARASVGSVWKDTCLASNSDSYAPASPSVSWTMEDLEEQIAQSGFVVSFSTFGPGYRAVARAQFNESLVLGYVEGFVRPAGKILHLDKMEVSKPMIEKARREGGDSTFDFGGFGAAIGMLLGYRCFLHGLEKGCSIAEFLAIDDEEFQHKRLVKYYKQFGFKIVKYVGEDVQDIPDRLVWGGCGTLMREEIPILMKKFTRLLALMKARQDAKNR